MTGTLSDSQHAAEPPAAETGRTRGLRQWHVTVLLLVGTVVVLAPLLEVVPEGRVAVAGLESYPLPHTCYVRILFGGRCPGCGLTRSFIHLAHGRWQKSLAVHGVGWILALALLLQVPYRIWALAGSNPAPLGERIPRAFGWSILAVLLGNWIARLLL